MSPRSVFDQWATRPSWPARTSPQGVLGCLRHCGRRSRAAIIREDIANSPTKNMSHRFGPAMLPGIDAGCRLLHHPLAAATDFLIRESEPPSSAAIKCPAFADHPHPPRADRRHSRPAKCAGQQFTTPRAVSHPKTRDVRRSAAQRDHPGRLVLTFAMGASSHSATASSKSSKASSAASTIALESFR